LRALLKTSLEVTTAVVQLEDEKALEGVGARA
jgi:hypothetical protein